jgi:hypothetical protein
MRVTDGEERETLLNKLVAAMEKRDGNQNDERKREYE